MENTVILKVERSPAPERRVPLTINIQSAENGFSVSAYFPGSVGVDSDKRYVARTVAELLRIIRDLVSDTETNQSQ